MIRTEIQRTLLSSLRLSFREANSTLHVDRPSCWRDEPRISAQFIDLSSSRPRCPMKLLLSHSAVSLLSALPSLAEPSKAYSAPSVEDSPASLSIIGGDVSKTCHFPSTIALSRAGGGKQFGCTGTLIHPRVMTTAYHCLNGKTKLSVVFGEDWKKPQIEVEAECAFEGAAMAPGKDFAYCELSREITEVPIVPILMGCELEALQKGTDVVPVGFGTTVPNQPKGGVKRQVTTPIADSMGQGGAKANEILVGHKDKGSCQGDSGGPTYIDLRTVPKFKNKKGAGWRVFGITSRKGPGGGVCASTTVYTSIHSIVEKIEKEFDVDVTPCFDSDGTWNPSPECKGFPDPEAGGSWGSCKPGVVSGYSHTCGDNPHDKGDDEKDPDEEDNENSTGEGEPDEDNENSTGKGEPDEEGDSSSPGEESGPRGEDSTSGDSDGTESSKPKDPKGKEQEEGGTPESSDSSSNAIEPKKRGSGCSVEDSGTKGGIAALLLLVLPLRRSRRLKWMPS